MDSLVFNAFKSADEIRCRLFDHRPFLSGEIRYTVKELEEKREWKECEGLAHASKQLELMKEKSDKILHQFREGQFTNCDFKLNSALLRGDQVIGVENDSKDQRALINLDRMSRYQEMEAEFNRKISLEMTRIENQIKLEEERLRDEFKKEEEELMNQIPN